jgi:hypothetical protein
MTSEDMGETRKYILLLLGHGDIPNSSLLCCCQAKGETLDYLPIDAGVALTRRREWKGLVTGRTRHGREIPEKEQKRSFPFRFVTDTNKNILFKIVVQIFLHLYASTYILNTHTERN